MKQKGGMETVIAAIIIIGIVVALIVSTVIPMAKEGQSTIGAATNTLVTNQTNIGPK